MLLREGGAPYPKRLLDEMGDLLDRDASNQGGTSRIAEIQASFQNDPKGWLETHLLPDSGDPRKNGEFTLTTR